MWENENCLHRNKMKNCFANKNPKFEVERDEKKFSFFLSAKSGIDVISSFFELDYINYTFCWKKKWKFLFNPFNLEHEILIGKAVFHFVSVEAILILSHGMHLSNSCAESIPNLASFSTFLEVTDGILANIDGCEESAVKWISEVKVHSHVSLLRRMSVLRLNQRCFKKSRSHQGFHCFLKKPSARKLHVH